ncbi:hypothetical protein KR009_007792 [Drosophila setifemur]|nr:hypothetical protein KR009_007792 [Drosophila setifemur]
MTEVEQPPQNGIDPTAAEEDDINKVRPADIEQDMREMERRKRVEAIMGSRLFREELERIVDSARDGGAGASGILQQLSDIVGVPVTRVGSVFKSNNCMVPINDIRGVESMGYAKGEKILRCKLAATFRLLDLYGWTQGLGAQITARLKVDQEYFLVNPYGLLYHEVTASSLNKVDMQGQIVEQGTTNFGVNRSHFVLHSVVHAARPDIRCAIYIGCSPVVAISSLKSGLLPLTKDACVLGEITTHAYTGLFDEEERNRLVRSLGPNSKVILLANHGALCCGETIEEAFYAACHIVQACETQLKLLPVGVDNLVLIPEESRKAIYEQSRRPPEDLEKKFAAVTAGEDGAAEKDAAEVPVVPKVGSPPKWRVGGADFEALMRMLDNAGYRTGYIYRHPLIKSDPPKPKNDVELPPAVSSLGYLLEEEELFRQGIWKKGDLRKGGDRSRWLNSPNVYQKVEVLETGTPDPKKITKWVAEGSPTHSTPVRIEDPLQFVPAGTTTREFKRVQQQIKDNRRADKISAGPQSHILEGVTWDEASRLKDATVSQTGDHVVMMGAASKGIIQRGFQHNATVYKAPYAKNPFDNVTDDELNEYKRTVERKKKSVHGEYTDTDFSESEAVLQAGAKKYPQSEPETEHQVIEIQTQQAPVPRQAEVVLSDGVSNHNENQIEEQDKENQHGRRERSSSGSGKCCRNLLPALNESSNVPSHQLYSNVYASAASLVQCLQPEVCSALLRPLHCELLSNLANCYRSRAGSSNVASSTTGTITTTHTSATGNFNTPHTSATGSSGGSSRRPLQMLRQQPYRTGSHFGFVSPRHQPRTEHKHLPGDRDRHSLSYRPMQRALSYEEIFATPSYEELCPVCFEQLLRLKPELQRLGGGAGGGDDEELVSLGSSSLATPKQLRKLPPLPELTGDTYEEILPRIQRDACTQTRGLSSSSTTNFLNQIERFNFSEESTNVNYTPGLVTSDISIFGLGARGGSSSAGASATSAAPPRVYHTDGADITEIWSFGHWQEPQEQVIEEVGQQPLAEHRLTLEITQRFPAGGTAPEEQVVRQLMTRDERQRRKSEFEELWQDHVQYFEAKEQVQQEAPLIIELCEHSTLDEQEAIAMSAHGWADQEVDKDQNESPHVGEETHPPDHASSPLDETLTEPTDELPKILEDFEDSLALAGQNLEKLVASTRRLQALDTNSSAVTSSSSLGDDNGNLYRSINLENIPQADDMATMQEEYVAPANSSISSGEEQITLNNQEQEEKRDDEKPVTPIISEPEAEEPTKKEMELEDEKDVDENDLEEEVVEVVEEFEEVESELEEITEISVEENIFTPLEREILHRIETDRLDESEAIFGKIDHTIRNKMTPKKLQDLVSEEIFRTRTLVYSTSPTNTTPMGSSLSAHNISAPSSSTAHRHLVTRPTARMSRSWAEEDMERVEQEEVPTQDVPRKENTPLERVISSTTFVCRPSPNRKRNFIQENIRNASRPRGSAGSVKKHRSNMAAFTGTMSPPLSVCAFQCGQQDSGARLWVSMPSPKRSTPGQRRNAGSPLYSVRRSPSSPYAKRRKPLVLLPLRRGNANPNENSSSPCLQRTVSSSTFFVTSEEHLESGNNSNGSFQMDNSQEESPGESPTEADKRNATNSTLYYSANSTRADSDRSQTTGEAPEEACGEMLFKPIKNEEYSETSNQTDDAASWSEPNRSSTGADQEESDKIDQVESNSSGICITKACELNPMIKMKMYPETVSSDDRPSTSKAAARKRQCAGAEISKQESSTDDEDAIVLDTICIVKGPQMIVREMVKNLWLEESVVGESQNDKLSEDWQELGGSFVDGLVGEGDGKGKEDKAQKSKNP